MGERVPAAAPAWLLELAAAAPAAANGTGNGHRPAEAWVAMLQGAPDGQRHDVAARIAGHYLGLGIAAAEVEEILVGFGARCTPPADDPEKLRRLARDLAAKDAQKSPATPAVAPPLAAPAEALVGLGLEFAQLYSQYLEAPLAFFYFVFLAYFGALVSRKITLASELRPQPRLYVVLLGDSADTRKSTALYMADRFFRSLGPEWELPVLYGVGSAEGMAAELDRQPSHSLLLHFDELKGFVDKAKHEGSVALPMVSTLFERNDYDNVTKKERLSVREAHVSLVAACTGETYATMFDRTFFAIGFLNRLWLVSDRTTKRIAVPHPIPDADVDRLRSAVVTRLQAIDQAWTRNGLRPVAYTVDPDALAVFDAWYAAREGSIFEKRLETYGHRLMLLLAATLGRYHVDRDIVERVVALLRYQLDVRRETDPVDAENMIAALEEKIRRALARGAMKRRDLQRRVHYNRVGIWAWDTALDNLKRAREVECDRARDLFWLASDGGVVTTSVTTPKTPETANGDGYLDHTGGGRQSDQTSPTPIQASEPAHSACADTEIPRVASGGDKSGDSLSGSQAHSEACDCSRCIP